MTEKELSKKVKLTRKNVLVIENNDGNFLLSDEPIKPRNTGKIVLASGSVRDINVGDNVFYSKAAGVYVTVGGMKYCLLSQNEIFGTVDKNLTDNDFKIGDTGDLYKYAEEMQQFYGLTGNNINLTGILL